MTELFRHRDVGDPRDELYVTEVDEHAPDLGVFFGAHNADEHVVVQVRAEKVDELIARLTEWKTQHEGDE